MKTDAERKNESLIRDVIDNTDFLDSWGMGDIQMPDFEYLKTGGKSSRWKYRRGNPRLLTIVGFVVAVMAVSFIMTIATNSELVLAGKFQLNNLVFNVKNGISASNIHLNSSPAGKELLIENEEQIPIGKDYLTELKTPGYIPDDYEFISLTITNNYKNDYDVTYIYINGSNDVLIINQAKLADYNRDVNMFNIKEDFYIGDAHFFYASSVTSEHNSITVITNNENTFISANFELDELSEIYKMYE